MNYDLLRLSYNIIRPVYERTFMHRGVIEEIESPSHKEAYAYCRKITRKYAKTFYLSIRLLPHHKQRSIFAIYALCRYLDNLVDEAQDMLHNTKIPSKDIKLHLQKCKNDLIHTYDGRGKPNCILYGFSDVLKSYKFPVELPLKLIDGVYMDLTKKRYDSFDELYDYSYKVASVVGLMITEIFGYSSKEALNHAVDMGIAMQLTNILRDVGEDLKNDRIYLPLEDLQKYRVTEEELKSENVGEGFIKMMKFQINRARKFYQSADQGIPLLSSDSRLPIYLASYNYRRILNKIEENNYQVFDRRAFLSTTKKLSILPKVWWNMQI